MIDEVEILYTKFEGVSMKTCRIYWQAPKINTAGVLAAM